jgi:hypothetical protein
MALRRHEELWRSGRFKLAVTAMTASMMLGTSCIRPDEGRGTVLTFVNETTTTVEISAAGIPDIFEILEPGETYRSHRAPNIRGECTETALVARDQSGTLVDRQLPPLCDGETWVITAEIGPESSADTDLPTWTLSPVQAGKVCESNKTRPLLELLKADSNPTGSSRAPRTGEGIGKRFEVVAGPPVPKDFWSRRFGRAILLDVQSQTFNDPTLEGDFEVYGFEFGSPKLARHAALFHHRGAICDFDARVLTVNERPGILVSVYNQTKGFAAASWIRGSELLHIEYAETEQGPDEHNGLLEAIRMAYKFSLLFGSS